MVRTELYPSWDYYQRNARPPDWVGPFIANVGAVQASAAAAVTLAVQDAGFLLLELGLGQHAR